MPAIIFPSNPLVGDSFVASNGYTYRWDGAKWYSVVGGTVSLLSLFQTQEAVGIITSATGVVNHNCLTQNIFYHQNIAGNFSINLTNFTLTNSFGTAVTIVLDQGVTEASVEGVLINGTTSTVYWSTGELPVPNPNAKDVISLSIINNSGTYVVLGQQVTFG